MSTMTADVKALISGLSGDPFGSRVFRDDLVPEDAALPYVSVIEDLSTIPTNRGDRAAMAWAVTGQVDLWIPPPTSAADRNLTLAEEVLDVLDGARAGGWLIEVQGANRIPSDDGDLPTDPSTHLAITIRRARPR